MKKIFISLFILLIVILGLNYSYAANASVAITASTTSATVGDEVKITVTINAATWNVTVSGGGISEQVTGYNGDAQNETVTKVYTLNTSTAGTYTINLTGDYTDQDAETSETINNKSVTVTVTEPVIVKSSNSKLKMLGITPNDFTGFKADTTTYNATVPYEVESVEVYAEKAEAVQTIKGTGSIALNVGINTASVVCTAEDGTSTTYTINITREKEVVLSNNNKLKMLGIRPNDFRNFKADTTTYYVNVPYETDSVEVYAEKAEDSQTISGTGNFDLKVGKNTLKVICTAENGTTKTYVMYVTREEETVKVVEQKIEEEPKEEIVEKIEVIEEPKTDDTTSETTIIGDYPSGYDSFISGTDKGTSIGITGITVEIVSESGEKVRAELMPEFEELVYNYVVATTINASKINVTAVAGTDKANVEVIGGNNLVEGSNEVSVIITTSKGKKAYEFNVVKSADISENVITNDVLVQLMIIAAIATVIIVAIVVIVVLIVKNSKKSKSSGAHADYGMDLQDSKEINDNDEK